MGVCAPKSLKTSLRLGGPRSASIYRFVDVSSYQSCQHWNFSAVIAKAYEFGYGPDSHTTCELDLNRDKPTGVYFFARAGDPYSQAQIAANRAKGVGATHSLPGTLDYEVSAGGCSYIRAFGERYMQLTGNRRFIVYSARFIWPTCNLDPRFILWDAAYGSHWNDLCCFAGGATMWQYTDGIYGPQPHYGSNLDVDIFLRSSPSELASQNVGPPPIPDLAKQRCSWLEFYLGRQREIQARGGQLGHWGRHEIRHHRKYLRDHHIACHSGVATWL